jgi:hypothetical protein
VPVECTPKTRHRTTNSGRKIIQEVVGFSVLTAVFWDVTPFSSTVYDVSKEPSSSS